MLLSGCFILHLYFDLFLLQFLSLVVFWATNSSYLLLLNLATAAVVANGENHLYLIPGCIDCCIYSEWFRFVNRRFPAQTSLLGCRTCDYDNCIRCAALRSEKVETGEGISREELKEAARSITDTLTINIVVRAAPSQYP